MTLSLPQSMIDDMVAHALADLPNECCGIVLGKDGDARSLFRARNAAASPFKYELHAEDLLTCWKEVWANDLDFLVIYHSHVASGAYPSPTDIRLAQTDDDAPMDWYPGAYYVLISLKDRANPIVRAYQIHAGEVTEHPLVAT